MWLVFNSKGQLLEQFEHGSSARAGSTDFEIFAVFTGTDVQSTYGSATIRFIKPDLENTAYPLFTMQYKNLAYEALGGENSDYLSDGTSYPGYYFNFSDFTANEDVVKLLDTAGLWRSYISLYSGNSKINVQGEFTFNVGSGNESEDGEEATLDNVTEAINAAISQKLSTDTDLYIHVVDSKASLESDKGYIYYVKGENKFYKNTSELTVKNALDSLNLTFDDDTGTVSLTINGQTVTIDLPTDESVNTVTSADQNRLYVTRTGHDVVLTVPNVYAMNMGLSGNLLSLNGNGNTLKTVDLSSLHVEKATKDGNGDNISSTYVKKSDLSSEYRKISDSYSKSETDDKFATNDELNKISEDYLKSSDKEELASAISSETQRATNAEQSNADAIASESSTRLKADEDIAKSIETETSERKSADSTLQDQIDNLKARGRYLSQWNCVTGKPETEPTSLPYEYKAGDYYIVGTVGKNNYKPDGTSYTGEASSVSESGDVSVDDVYYYDGSVWHLQLNTQKTIRFANIAGEPTDNANLKTALDAKQDDLSSDQLNAANSGITKTKVSGYDSHIADKNNPHNVTAEQVGLGNVNNTSDADKPISTATQTALDAKQDALTFATNAEIDALFN